MALGVSATHLDWTMVPYVRFSFMKHFIINYLKTIDSFATLDLLRMSNEELDDWISQNKSIYLKEQSLTKDDFVFEGKIKDTYTQLYNQALFDTVLETKQAIEGFMHNANSLQSRSGNQLPFTSINYGTCTLPEGRMVNRLLLEMLIEGTGKHHRTSVFPCGIFQVKKGINRRPGDPNYDLFRLALKATALRLYPNYCNCDWSVQQNCVKLDRETKARVLSELSDSAFDTLSRNLEAHPDQLPLLGLEFKDGKLQIHQEETPLEMNGTMGCRTWNGFDVNFENDYRKNIVKVIDGELLPDYVQTSGIQKDGRGNICPVTIILPTVAMEADRDVEKFMHLLDVRIHEAMAMLIERFDHMSDQSAASATFMYDNHTMVGYEPDKGVVSALKHGTLVIGKLGLAEALQLLVGCDHTEPKGMDLAKRIQQLYKDRCNEFKKMYRANVGVYETPGFCGGCYSNVA